MAYIKADKLGRIYAIVTTKKEFITPEQFKPTLNMFRGRQIQNNLKACLEYLRISLEAQNGNEEAQKELNEIHYRWNHQNN